MSNDKQVFVKGVRHVTTGVPAEMTRLRARGFVPAEAGTPESDADAGQPPGDAETLPQVGTVAVNNTGDAEPVEAPKPSKPAPKPKPKPQA